MLYDKQASSQQIHAALQTLVTTLETILKLLHPIIPFLTEEIWQYVKAEIGIDGKTIMTQAFPESKAEVINLDAESNFDWLKSVVTQIRTIRSEMNVPPNKKITLFIKTSTKNLVDCVNQNKMVFMNLIKAESIEFTDKALEQSATAIVDNAEFFIPIAGLIDKDEEIKRLTKEINRLEGDITRSDTKLNNQGYVDKAPAEVVASERLKLEENKRALEKLTMQLTAIQVM